MSQGGRLHLEDVISHLSGRNASLRRAETPDGVPMQTEADRRGDDLAVTVTQGERAQGTRCSHNETLSSTVEDLGMKTVLLATTFQHTLKCTVSEAGILSTSAPVDAIWNTIRAKSRFFVAIISSNSCLSIVH